MISNNIPNIDTVFNYLKESYKFIDYREALFKVNGAWKTIVSIFRFTNKSYEEISAIHKDLKDKAFNTDHFKLNFKILNLEGWISNWHTLRNQIDEIDNSINLATANLSRNRKQSYSSWISDVDREYNSVQFNIFLVNVQEHQKRFQFLEGHQEIRSKGVESIYPIIRQILQISSYDFGTNLYSTFIFPVYLKISKLKYVNNYLSGNIEYHKIFSQSSIFIEKRFRGDSLGNIGDFDLKSIEKKKEIENQDNLNHKFIIFIDSDQFKKEEYPNYENEVQLLIKLYFEPLNLNLIEFGEYLSSIQDEISGFEKIPPQLFNIITPILKFNLLAREEFKEKSGNYVRSQNIEENKKNIEIILNNYNWLIKTENVNQLKTFFISAANQNHVGYLNIFRSLIIFNSQKAIINNLIQEKDIKSKLNDLVIFYSLGPLLYNYKLFCYNMSLEAYERYVKEVYDKYFRKTPVGASYGNRPYYEYYDLEYPKILREYRLEISDEITCLIYFIYNNPDFFEHNSIYIGFLYHGKERRIWIFRSKHIVNSTLNFINEIINQENIEVIESINIPKQLSIDYILEDKEDIKKKAEKQEEWIKENRVSIIEWKLGDQILKFSRFNIFVGKNNSGKTFALESIFTHPRDFRIDKPDIKQSFDERYPGFDLFEFFYIPRYRILDTSSGKRKNPVNSLISLLFALEKLQSQEDQNFIEINGKNEIKGNKFQLNLWKIPNFIEIIDLSTYIFEDEGRLDEYNRALIKNECFLSFIKSLRIVYRNWVRMIHEFLPDIEINSIKEKGLEGEIKLEIKDNIVDQLATDWRIYGSGTQELLSLIFIIEFLKSIPVVDLKQLRHSLIINEGINNAESYIKTIKNNRVILLDEPEISIHPSLQKKFFYYLYESSRIIQIFLATNSPYFLDIKDIEDHLNDDIAIFLCKKDKEYENYFSKININKGNYIKIIDEIFDYNPLETAFFLSKDNYSYILKSDFNLIELDMIKNLINKRFEREADYDILIQLGTLNIDHQTQLIQNVHFLISKPTVIDLNLEGVSVNKLNQVFIYQLNLCFKENLTTKKERFTQFIGSWWDKKLASDKYILKYTNNNAEKILNKIEDELKEIKKSEINRNKCILVLPENSIPYIALEFLIDFAKKNQIVIIGGMEDSTVKSIRQFQKDLEKKGIEIVKDYTYEKIEAVPPITEDTFINQAIIINSDMRICFQIKNLPFYHPKFTEGVSIIYNPFFRVFNTVVGKIVIFICKDFLVNYEVIDKWMELNDTKLLIIPSLTSLVNPFRSKLTHLTHQIKNQDKTFIFVNVAEYGGSGLYNYRREHDFEPSHREPFNAREELCKIFIIDN